jgi:hypothetical protein
MRPKNSEERGLESRSRITSKFNLIQDDKTVNAWHAEGSGCLHGILRLRRAVRPCGRHGADGYAKPAKHGMSR